MAIYDFQSRILGRSQGNTAVGYAAYCAAEKLQDERYDEVRNFSKPSQRERLYSSEIIAPEGSPQWSMNREVLWNTVEKAERRKDSQLAREIHVALPVELSHEQKRELVRRYVREEYSKKGMVADVSCHNFEGKDSHNPHAHILLTTRKIEQEGFAKTKEEKWRPKIVKDPKTKKPIVDPEFLAAERKTWENYCNHALEQAGRKERIDCRSLKDRGSDRLPAPKLKAAHYMEKRSEWEGKTWAGDNWRQVKNTNASKEKLDLLQAEHDNLQQQIKQEKILLGIERVGKIAREEKEQKPTQERSKKQQNSDPPMYKHAAAEFKKAEQDQRALLKQLLDQQADRERDKSRSSGEKSPSHELERDGNLDQKLANLKSAMTEFSASVEELKQTTAKTPKRKKQPPRSPPKNHDNHPHQPKR